MAGVFYFPLIGTPTGVNYQLSFYEAGTDVPLDVWTDSDLSIPWSQPIVLNAAGESDGPIYVSPSPSYKVVYERPAVPGTDTEYVAVPGYPVDFVSPSTIINVMTTAITVLTNAQIKALPSTGIELVAAPASGLRVKPMGATLHAETSAGAYTNISATSAALSIEADNGYWVTIAAINDSGTSPALTQVTDFLGVASEMMIDLPAPYAASPGTTSLGWVTSWGPIAIADIEAVAITLRAFNAALGDFTGGNAANTLTVTLYYALESVA